MPFNRLALLDRSSQALKLRREGVPIVEIALQLNVSPGTIRTDLRKAFLAITTENVEEMRELENERLEDLWRKSYAIVANEDSSEMDKLRATDRCLAIVKLRSELMGLNQKETGNNGQKVIRDISYTVYNTVPETSPSNELQQENHLLRGGDGEREDLAGTPLDAEATSEETRD